MPWTRFTQDFDFTPEANRRVTIAYKADTTLNVTRECAAKALTAGKAVKAAPPRSRKEADLVRQGGAVTPEDGHGVDAA
jgi:hypothetical protein